MRGSLLLLATLSAVIPVGAQHRSNLEIFQDQAVTCLGEVPDNTNTFMLQSPSVMPYLKAALVTGWTGAGHAVFEADSARTRTLPRLSYLVEETNVTYERARRKQLARTVSLALQYSWTSGTGQILRNERCAQASDDLILRRFVAAVETPNYPETIGTVPASSFTRRYLEPIALGAASALTVFLFFNLRSKRASSGG